MMARASIDLIMVGVLVVVRWVLWAAVIVVRASPAQNSLICLHVEDICAIPLPS